MYDSLIAAASETLTSAQEQQLLDNLENNSGGGVCLEDVPITGDGVSCNKKYCNCNASAQVRWENCDSRGKCGGGGGHHPNIRTSCYKSNNSSFSNNGASAIVSNSCITDSVSRTMNGVMTTKGGSCIGNLNNNKNKTHTPPTANNSVNQEQIYGVLSRRLGRWSSNPRKSSCNSSVSPSLQDRNERSNKDEREASDMLTTMNGEKLLINGKEQRPMSVNSVISSTSSSSCSSESSTSLSGCTNGGGGVVGSTTGSGVGMPIMVAPRASPEEEDCATIPDADISDDEEGTLDKCPYHHHHLHHHHHIHQCAKKSNNNNSSICTGDHNGSNGTERCFSNSAAKGKTETKF